MLINLFQSDVCLSGYRKHLVAQDAPAPLTNAEEELAYIKQTEVKYICIICPNKQDVCEQNCYYFLINQLLHKVWVLKRNSH